MEEQEITERPNLESFERKRETIIEKIKECNSLGEMIEITKDFFALALKKQHLFLITQDELEEYTKGLNDAFWEDVVVETGLKDAFKYKDTITEVSVIIPEELYEIEGMRHGFIHRGLNKSWIESDIKEATAKISEEMWSKIYPVLIFFLDDLTQYSFIDLEKLNYITFSTLFLGENSDYEGKSIMQAFSLEMKRMIKSGEFTNIEDVEIFKKEMSGLVSEFKNLFKANKMGIVQITEENNDEADEDINDKPVRGIDEKPDWNMDWDINEESDEEEEWDIDAGLRGKCENELDNRGIFLFIIENLFNISLKKRLSSVVRASDLICIQDLMMRAEQLEGLSKPWVVYAVNCFTGWIDYLLYVKDGNMDEFDYTGIALKWEAYNIFSPKYGECTCGAGIRQKLNYYFWQEAEELKAEIEIEYDRVKKAERLNCILFEEIYSNFANCQNFGTKRDLFNFCLEYFKKM